MKKFNLLNNVLGWVCFVIAAVTYLLTIEPTASFWDCPEFISQGAKLEVGHPPGNPIFMLCARFFVTIFGNDISRAAIAVNSMSALLSAATILLLFWTITHLVRRLIVRDDANEIAPWRMAVIFAAGFCGALAYTWSDTFWFSAVEGEVYAFSSFCTALVFWLILKWENRADAPHSDRYLILIAYVIGVSIAVHLLNLLCIPAIVLVFYYRKFKDINAKGSLIALAVSFVIVGLILYGLVPGFVKVSQWFELMAVNGFGLPYNSGVFIYTCILVAVFIWAVVALNRQRSASAIRWSFLLAIALSGMPFIGSSWLIGLLLTAALVIYLFGFCKRIPVRIFNVVVLSVFLIFVGYSSYALLLIRSHANPPMNQQAPDNVFTLASYLNREQYGERPLFIGPSFAEELHTVEVGDGQQVVYVDELGYPMTTVAEGLMRDENGTPYSDPTTTYTKKVKSDSAQADEYVETTSKLNYKDADGLGMIFPRIYSTAPDHVDGYKGWTQYSTPDIYDIPENVRAKWAAQGYAPLYEVAPYLSSQSQIVTYRDHSGNDISNTSVWKPGYWTNIKYFFGYQLTHMYWRYFMWNFAGRQNDFQGNGEPHLGNWISGIPAIDNWRLGDQSLLPDEFGKGNKGHNVFYMLPLILGLIGLLWQAFYVKKDAPMRGIEQFWVVFFLFFMTGMAIVLYLNQTPGQPRERDYAFAGSFYAFAIWIGIGIPAIAMMVRSAFKKNKKAGTVAGVALGCVVAVAVPLQMVSQTWDDHDRSGRYTARDFGMNYLASVDPNGIIFCNGDNDTFPLWYAQEVEGYRTDVRVVNLSYLTAGWYADQQRIPSYDGAPVPMYATPQDYAYDNLAYSFIVPTNTAPTEARVALDTLYRTVFQGKYHALTSPNIYMPVDRAAAARAFGIAPSDSAALAAVSDVRTDVSRLGKNGLSLSNALTLDIVANSVAGGFRRPVFFAATVPDSYHVGLTPFTYSTGMAVEVTPFGNAAVSPVAEKAYRNIMGEFRWGGLDTEHPEKLYLDETVRRMVASTRSAIYSTARDLIRSGSQPASEWARQHALKNGYKAPETRADMGRILLETIRTNLPVAAAPYDGLLGISMAESYYDLYRQDHNPADLTAAKEIINSEVGRWAQLVRYAQNLTPSQLSLLGGSELNGLQYLGLSLSLANRIAVLEALEKNPDANAEILAEWGPRQGFDATLRSAPLIYVSGLNSVELEQLAEDYGGANETVFAAALATLRAHQAAGISPTALTDSIIREYGIDRGAWLHLLRI